MKTILSALVTVACALTFCVSSFASAEYVIANHDSNFNNYLTVYKLDTSSGSLKQVALLATNGSGLGGGINVNRANIEQAITANGSCIFALNAGSSDISGARFRALMRSSAPL